MTVWLGANSMYYLKGGGHLWVYLNWALGLRAAGCDVVWMEGVWPKTPVDEVVRRIELLRHFLRPFALDQCLSICPWDSQELPDELLAATLPWQAGESADLLLNLRLTTHANIVRQFRRSAILDIDPGLFQYWVSTKSIDLPPHDLHFTIGETVGQPGSQIADLNLRWHYTPPCVSTDHWTMIPPQRSEHAAFTTITHWNANEWAHDFRTGALYLNSKATGFLPFLDVPQLTRHPLELALLLGSAEQEERQDLLRRGWRVIESHSVSSTPADYQRYIQLSLGEFSAVKPSCTRMQNAWISDRSLCFLASGKPCIVQHTGPSRFLPDADGLFRFRTPEEAARCVDEAMANYDHHCGAARRLAEQVFDAKRVATHVLETALS